MNLYGLLKFVHVLSAGGFFAAFAAEWIPVQELRSASGAEQARRGISLLNRVRWIGGLSLLVALASGIYLASTAWSWEAGWIRVSFGSLVLMAILGGTINGRRIPALAKAIPESGALPEAWRARVRDPLLSLSLLLRIALTVGIVFLMTVKIVETWKALAVMALAVGAGVAASVPAWRRA